MTKLDPVKSTPFMSVVEGRRPRQKVHTTLAHAKSAFDTPKPNPLCNNEYRGHAHTHGWGAIYEFIGGDWVEIYTIQQPTQADKIGKKYNDFETRPWRRNDRSNTRNEGLRTAPHQGTESAGAGEHLGGVPEAGGGAPEGGDDQRAAGGRHDQAGLGVREADRGHSLTRQEAVEEMQRSRSKFEFHQARWAETGRDYDHELMLRFEGRMHGLGWVVERMTE